MSESFYCTLFDSAYLARGLVMLESLKAVSPQARVFVFAFDARCARVLSALRLPDVTVIPLVDFEDEHLLAVKPGRSRAEYCWTCTPSVIRYAIERYQLPICTYLDADLRFYHDPEILLEELGAGSVLITEHRYTPCHDETRSSGKYCVQFLAFRNDEHGRKALQWWRDACLDWCFARAEDGKFGDQKYLDDWPVRFPGVRELRHLGGGVAPWNIQQYELFVRGSDLQIRERASGSSSPLVFYHFQAVKFLRNGTVDLGFYRLSREAFALVYAPYLREVLEANAKLNLVEPHDYLATAPPPPALVRILKYLRRLVKRRYNVHPLAGVTGRPCRREEPAQTGSPRIW